MSNFHSHRITFWARFGLPRSRLLNINSRSDWQISECLFCFLCSYWLLTSCIWSIFSPWFVSCNPRISTSIKKQTWNKIQERFLQPEIKIVIQKTWEPKQKRRERWADRKGWGRKAHRGGDRKEKGGFSRKKKNKKK